MGMQVSSSQLQQGNTRSNWMYGIVSAVTGLFFLLLYAGGTGQFLGQTLISWQTDDVVDGIKSNGSLIGKPDYTAWATRDDAGFFVNMPNAMTLVVEYVVLVGLVLLVAEGVKRRSFALSFSPPLVALVVTTVVSAGITPFDNYVPIVAGVLMLAAVAAAIYRNRDTDVLTIPRRTHGVPESEDVTETTVHGRDPRL
jgi:heme A synthase